MLKAKLDSVRKNKKGFSLVELIIVIAIMVALVAVMAPSFVKYVQKSRDSALASAAEDFLTAVKTYYIDPENSVATTEVGTIVLKATGGSPIDMDFAAAIGGSTKNGVIAMAGVDTAKIMGKSGDTYTITIAYDSTEKAFTFNMTKA